MYVCHAPRPHHHHSNTQTECFRKFPSAGCQSKSGPVFCAGTRAARLGSTLHQQRAASELRAESWGKLTTRQRLSTLLFQFLQNHVAVLRVCGDPAVDKAAAHSPTTRESNGLEDGDMLVRGEDPGFLLRTHANMATRTKSRTPTPSRPQ